MFDNLPVFIEPENINARPVARAMPLLKTMQNNIVALGNRTLEMNPFFRILAPIYQNIDDAGVEHKDALAAYGVTDAKLADLQTAINGYTGEVAKPRNAIVDRKVTKAQIKDLFKQADEILVEQMDKLIEDFAEDNPEFVAQYNAARIIIDPKTGKKINSGTGGNPPA
jgi:hypothetical protein